MRRLALTAIAALILIMASAAVAEAATCNQLPGRNLATNGKVKIVRTKLKGGRSRFFGCVLPRGTARPIGPLLGPDISGYDTSQTIRAIKGTFVTAELYGSVGETSSTYGQSSVYNLATGRSYVFDAQSSSEDGQEFYGLGQSERRFLNAKGQLIASYLALKVTDAGEESEVATIAVFSATGKRTILDRGPADTLAARSLKVTGRTASWTSGRNTKTYTLAA